MKHLFLIPILFILSCEKQMNNQVDELLETSSIRSVASRNPNGYTSNPSTQIGRVTIQLFSDSSNLTDHRLDFAEILYGDTFSNEVDIMDSIKTVDFTDNLAIKPVFKSSNELTRKLLVKEYKRYPEYLWLEEYTQLKLWNLNPSRAIYWFKFTGSNFPAVVNAYLYDSYLHTYTLLPTKYNKILWIPFDAYSEEQKKSMRFSILTINQN